MVRLAALVRHIKDLGLVALVALGVVLSSTAVGSLIDRVHPVDAEQQVAHQNSTVPAAGGTSQVLALPAWHVTITFPQDPALSTVQYVSQGNASVGLSTSSLSHLGPACNASHNALGVLVRFPAGHWLATTQNDLSYHFVATVGDYDYGYQTTATACAELPGAAALINQQNSVIFGSLSSIAPML